MENRSKMTPHSRAALDAADTLRSVIASFDGQGFMAEAMSEDAARRHAAVESSPDALDAMARGMDRSYAERIARVEKQ